MQSTKTADVSQNRVDLECRLPEVIQYSKINHKSRHMHEILWKNQATILRNTTSGVGLGAGLLQTRNGTSCPRDMAPDNNILRPIAFASKSLSIREKRYSNIEREALGILHGLEKFHHYCFAREVSIITDHKPLVAIFKKDIATLSQKLQWILLRIHQYRVKIIYKPGPDLFIADWLSRQNYKEDKNEEIAGMQVNVNSVEMAKDPRMYHDTWTATSNGPRTFTTTERMHQKKMAREQNQYTTEPQTTQHILRQHGSNWQNHPKRQTYSDTRYIAETSTRTTPYESYGNGKKQNSLHLNQYISQVLKAN